MLRESQFTQRTLNFDETENNPTVEARPPKEYVSTIEQELKQKLRSRKPARSKISTRNERGSHGTGLPAPTGYFAYCQRCKLRGKEFRIDARSPYVVIARMSTHVETEHALECAFCYWRFRDFADLAKHVKESCRGIERIKNESTETETWEQTAARWKATGATSGRGL